MWILEAQSLGSSDERSVRVQTIKHYLTAGSHVVGRNVTAGQSSVILEEDKSISRGHAVISVAYGEQACFKVRDKSRYGTLVNREELKGAETHLKEGDLLQFGHKSNFRVRRWHCSIAVLEREAMLLQQLAQLGFVQQPAESASCMMLPDRAPMTADLACTLAHQKPYVTRKWLQAILERPSLSDPPAQMADFKPLIYTACSPQGLHLPLVYNQHLLTEFEFTVPSQVALENPKLEAGVQLHGGIIRQQDTSDKCCVLIVADMQTADIAAAPPNAANLHITTVDHILDAMLRSDTSSMTRPVSREELPKVDGTVPLHRSVPASNKRMQSPGLTAPAQKKQHTEHVQATSTTPTGFSEQDKQAGASAIAAEIAQQYPALVHSSQDANLHATQAADSQSGAATATPNTASNPADAAHGSDAQPSAPPQQAAAHSLGQMPDNNTILWEPLVVRVQRPMPARVDDQMATPNFKRFRKLQPSLAAHNTVPFSAKGYAEHNIDSEAFLNQQKSRQQQQQVAEELFNAKVRVQKQPAASKPARGRGRGRGRAA